jgi:hypothetical protein
VQFDRDVTPGNGVDCDAGDKFGILIRQQACVGIECKSMRTAQELMKGHAGGLAPYVPLGDLDARQRVIHRAVAAKQMQLVTQFRQ